MSIAKFNIVAVRDVPLSEARAALAAEYVDYPNWPWDDAMKQLPLGVRLLLKEYHEALTDCEFRTPQRRRCSPDEQTVHGVQDTHRSLDRDDHRWLLLDNFGRLDYRPKSFRLDRGHLVMLQVHPSGKVSWWHGATAKGEDYGRLHKMGGGHSPASLRVHFKGVAPTAQMTEKDYSFLD